MPKTTKEDYLRAIYHFLEEENKTEVKSVDISDYLNLSKATVSEMLKKLMKEGLIQSAHYGKIKLTKKGLVESKDITKKHRIIEVFLSTTLNINPKLIHDEAHRLEHAFSNESINSIAKLINTDSCPHGKPIPKIKGE
jgi:DtxR family Mn-dependent transcriptional regulator|tara:strand:- start:1024 stop:1437 length:414 start_codon:yes stop_codon:yes gene_type:complete